MALGFLACPSKHRASLKRVSQGKWDQNPVFSSCCPWGECLPYKWRLGGRRELSLPAYVEQRFCSPGAGRDGNTGGLSPAPTLGAGITRISLPVDCTHQGWRSPSIFHNTYLSKGGKWVKAQMPWSLASVMERFNRFSLKYFSIFCVPLGQFLGILKDSIFYLFIF